MTSRRDCACAALYKTHVPSSPHPPSSSHPPTAKQQNKLDGINLFALLSIISFFYTLPVAIAVEGLRGGVWQWGPLWNQAVATLGQAQFYKLMAAAGLFYHLYNQASYMVLDQGISPVTFSVGNTMKRVAVVVSSVLFFRNPVSGRKGREGRDYVMDYEMQFL